MDEVPCNRSLLEAIGKEGDPRVVGTRRLLVCPQVSVL